MHEGIEPIEYYHGILISIKKTVILIRGWTSRI